MEFISRLESFLQLKKRLSEMPEDALFNIKSKANSKNPWFTEDNIDLALQGIMKLLDENNLQDWVNKYSLSEVVEKKVGLISAGNIPMVGFHDVLCVLMSGHKLLLKLSHQDDVLLPFILEQLTEIDQGWKNQFSLVDKLNDAEAVIATGSDNSARYFEYYFMHVPRLIRKNRTSLAVLGGNEKVEDLSELGNDIYQYFGFGCRNVAKILLPEGYELPLLLDQLNDWSFLADHHKYVNNYNYHRAIFSMESIPYLDNGFSIYTQNSNLTSPTSIIYYDFYKKPDDAIQYINENSEKIQCVVAGEEFPYKNKISFGQTQSPTIFDYADNVDTMNFLLSI